MFAQAVIPVSWFFFAAIPPFLIIAVLIDHASVSSWLRRPPIRVFGLVLLSFLVLSIGGALMTLSTRPAGVLVAGAVGLFNAYAWRATVSGVVSRRAARRTASVPAALIVFLAVVVGGSAIGFAAKAPRVTDRKPLPDNGTSGRPVLIVKGFGGSYAGGRTYDLGRGFLTRRFSYAGSSTTAEVSKTSIPSMPRSVFAASWSAAWAASRHDCVDTPTRSMVLMTDIRTPCAPDYLRDCRGRGRSGAKRGRGRHRVSLRYMISLNR